MENWEAAITTTVFISVILMIMTEWLHLTIAAFLGALILVFTHVVTLSEAISYISSNYATLALFFGVMVLVRSFEPTNIFSYLATQIIILAKGQGKRLLLGIATLTALVGAVLPNATSLILLTPLIPPLAEDLGIDFVPLFILMIVVANSAGLLTLVGDPATFIVGDAIDFSFSDYFWQLSLGGVIAILAIIATLPFLFRELWNQQLEDLEHLPHPQINHPRILGVGAVIVAFVLLFFVIGDTLPVPISPAAVALMGAALALLLAHHTKIDTLNKILKDVDWSTILFFMSIFVLIGSLQKTGVINQISALVTLVLGQNIVLGSILLIFVTGLISSVIPNIPLVVAFTPLLKQYLVNAGLASSEVLSSQFQGQFPLEVLPLFYAMLYGVSLGGNGTLVGASANIVAAGIAEHHGSRISFKRYLKYGIPITTLQLGVIAIFVTLRFLL